MKKMDFLWLFFIFTYFAIFYPFLTLLWFLVIFGIKYIQIVVCAHINCLNMPKIILKKAIMIRSEDTSFLAATSISTLSITIQYKIFSISVIALFEQNTMRSKRKVLSLKQNKKYLRFFYNKNVFLMNLHTAMVCMIKFHLVQN